MTPDRFPKPRAKLHCKSPHIQEFEAGQRNEAGQTSTTCPSGRTRESRHRWRRWFQQENVRDWQNYERWSVADCSGLDEAPGTASRRDSLLAREPAGAVKRKPWRISHVRSPMAQSVCIDPVASSVCKPRHFCAMQKRVRRISSTTGLRLLH